MKREEGKENAIEKTGQGEGEVLLKTMEQRKKCRLNEDCNAQVFRERAELRKKESTVRNFFGDAGGNGNE